MSTEWMKDIQEMHKHYGHKEAASQLDEDKLLMLLQFRLNFLEEELEETKEAAKRGDAQEVLDGLIDLVVVANGTMDLLFMDAQGAWDDVLRANMEKESGYNPSRPNPMGLPDLSKPKGWKGPDHTGRADVLDDAFKASAFKKQYLADKLQIMAHVAANMPDKDRKALREAATTLSSSLLVCEKIKQTDEQRQEYRAHVAREDAKTHADFRGIYEDGKLKHIEKNG